jgi:hypothetical protein
MNQIKKLFWWCSGANEQLLAESKTESSKYVGIGATVFFTGIFAALSGAYALFMVFDNVFWAILFGIIWGLMIFNLDRYIVSSMRKEGRFFSEFKMAFPRLILAVLISLVIAKPLELKIFEKEINGELAIMEQEVLAEQANGVKLRFEQQRLQIENRIDRLKKEIEIKSLTRDKLRKTAQEEADGTGGSMKVNAGPIYQIKKADADRVDEELTALISRNSILIAEQEAALDNIMASVGENIESLTQLRLNGPAARMEALSRLSASSQAIWLANWFILFLFIAIETAPVFVKLISPLGPYDHLLRLEEYPFEVSRAENIGVMTANAKERTVSLPNLEREFVEERLSRSMFRS